MVRLDRELARWLVSRSTLHEAMRHQEDELRNMHDEYVTVTVDLARAERRIRELEDQNLRLLRVHDFHLWESEQ